MLRPDATILRTPFPITEEVEAFPTPDRYRLGGADVPATLPTLAVFREETLEGGVVGVPEGFEDSPDAEVLAGGVSRMALGNPAIARHGAFVLWGFHGEAADFTATGRRLFLNVLACAASHAGEHVIARRDGTPRAYAKVAAADRPFVRWTRTEAEVDQDARELGIGTGRVEFLEAVAERLWRDPGDGLAARLVARYVPGVGTAEFPAWLVRHRAEVFFTEWGGYVWLVPPPRGRYSARRAE